MADPTPAVDPAEIDEGNPGGRKRKDEQARPDKEVGSQRDNLFGLHR